MDARVSAWLAGLLGSGVSRVTSLSGGCVAEVWGVGLEDGRGVVVKVGGGTLGVEARMLGELSERSGLPVPRVLGVSAEPEALAMERVEHGGALGEAGERHAAELLGALHGVTARVEERGEGGASFGFGCDTVIGPLGLPNGWMGAWVEFFRERRLLHFTRVARDRGRIGGGLVGRLERLAGALDAGVCPGPGGAAGDVGRLVHGDVWGGNVLVEPGGGRVAAFIDPALHFGHPESELAFSTLFGTFGRAFFERYAEVSDAVGDWDEFWGCRRDLYNVVPLLVHVILFGGGYVSQLESAVERTGLV